MPTASNYLCGCGRFMHVVKNSVTVEEFTDAGTPYKLWSADLLECDECGVQVIAGFGRAPLAEHYQPNYAETRERLAPIYPGRCREQRADVPLVVEQKHEWEFYMNGSFCKRCGVAIGSGQPCLAT